MPEAALDAVAYDRTTYGFAHDETRTYRGSSLPRYVRVRDTASKVDDEEWASGPAPSSYSGREVLAPPQPVFGGQHDVMT
jgi:hypothetical protein